MGTSRAGQIAVIFASQRRDAGHADYQAAAEMMERLAQSQPGFVDMMSARSETGFGITVSYWEDEASAVAWRNHAVHARIRERGRAEWYEDYTVEVAAVTRNYDWTRSD